MFGKLLGKDAKAPQKSEEPPKAEEPPKPEEKPKGATRGPLFGKLLRADSKAKLDAVQEGKEAAEEVAAKGSDGAEGLGKDDAQNGHSDGHKVAFQAAVPNGHGAGARDEAKAKGATANGVPKAANRRGSLEVLSPKQGGRRGSGPTPTSRMGSGDKGEWDFTGMESGVSEDMQEAIAQQTAAAVEAAAEEKDMYMSGYSSLSAGSSEQEEKEELPSMKATPTVQVSMAAGSEAARLRKSGEDGEADGSQGIDTENFGELTLDPEMVGDVRGAWKDFLEGSETIEAAGEAIYSAIFEGAPSLQPLFVTPRAVQAVFFAEAVDRLVRNLDNPAALKVQVENLGFTHLNFEVTVPRVVLFRDALLDMLDVELGDRLSTNGLAGWVALLNYVGGALMYVRIHYGSRLKLIIDSWQVANSKAKNQRIVPVSAVAEAHEGPGGEGGGEGGGGEGLSTDMAKQAVPCTFNDMFHFNAAVMGFGNRIWFAEVLACFDRIVTSVASSAKLQMECDFLILRIGKCKETGPVNLWEFKSCMLACLRSLLPKQWDSNHETAWGWLWDNVERLLKQGSKTNDWESHLTGFMRSLDDEQKYEVRKVVYDRFFEAAPVGQDYFKQSSTRLHFIAERIMQMTVEIFQDPWSMIDEISALGLRHVGYGIPTDLFAPYVTAAIHAIEEINDDAVALEAFRWSLGLIAKALVQTINEGSTIVMKAINANSVHQLKKAMSCAPRGERAKWVLLVQVGTQSISPLQWALDTGSLDTAGAIIKDLLTIRADREKYYYGVDELFLRHPDIVKRLCIDAPSLLESFLDGLVWRSAIRENGVRRVNYYVKHLILNDEGNFSDALKHLVNSNDPVIMSHAVIVLVSDILWGNIVRRRFTASKVWFIVSLMVFMLCQAILPKSDYASTRAILIAIFLGRLIGYAGTMTRLFWVHMKDSFNAYRSGHTMKVFRCVTVPSYLHDPYRCTNLVLAFLLFLMLCLEPMLHCLGPRWGDGWPTEDCPEARAVEFKYSIFCMCAMLLHWLLLMDLSVFNTELSAFVLVCVHVFSEISRFLIALCFLLFTFASAISVLEHTYYDMSEVPETILALFAITVQVYEDDYRDLQEDPVLLVAVFVFVVASAILLLNLLIAQLNVSYLKVNRNMKGYARLKRAQVICETLDECPKKQWDSFVQGLGLDKPLEFNQGDVGMPGGLQQCEPATRHLVSQDSILRFGGSSSPLEKWPDTYETEEEEDKFDRMQRVIQGSLKNILARTGHGGRRKKKTKQTADGHLAVGSAGASSIQDGSSYMEGSGAAGGDHHSSGAMASQLSMSEME